MFKQKVTNNKEFTKEVNLQSSDIKLCSQIVKSDWDLKEELKNKKLTRREEIAIIEKFWGLMFIHSRSE